MKSLAAGALRGLAWLAVLWTLYEEQRHLALYLGASGIAFGIGDYIDIAASVVLLVYAGYEVFHFLGRSGAVDRILAAHPAIEAARLVLLAALAWGIYRDIGHFQHLFLGAGETLAPSDEIDEVAAGFLALGGLKTGYHALRALLVMGKLRRRGKPRRISARCR
ncbi:MAG TPA: hypothetical protein VGL83_18980 [Stellaceae bacterium]|jgi:hypothetical protein